MGGYTLIAFLTFIVSVIYLMECRVHFWTADAIAKEELDNIDIHRVVQAYINREQNKMRGKAANARNMHKGGGEGKEGARKDAKVHPI